MKKCFTINLQRSTEEFQSYYQLFESNTYQAIEIFYPFNLDDEKKTRYTKNVREIKNKYPNIEVVMHLPHGMKNNLSDLDNFQNIVERMKDGIKYTSQFDTKKLTLHLGYVKTEIERCIFIEHIVRVLKDLTLYASQFKMNLMIENMPGIKELGYSPNEILEIINKVNMENLKFIFDTGHAHVSEFNPVDYLYTLKDHLHHIHYNDNNGTRDEHIRIGLGNIDFKAIFKALDEIKYGELHCMEVIYKDVNDLVLFASDLDKYSN